MQKTCIVIACAVLLLGAGCAPQPQTTTDTDGYSSSSSPTTDSMAPAPSSPVVILPSEQITDKQIRITTAKGDVVFRLFADTAPLAVSNFVSLTSSGFYDGLTFHRRVEGFVVQGGDPLGTGYGGPGYQFADELSDDRTYTRGIVAMANSGEDTNGSQFFIMLADYALPKNYTIFGEVTEGMDVVDALVVGDVMTKVTVEDAE